MDEDLQDAIGDVTIRIVSGSDRRLHMYVHIWFNSNRFQTLYLPTLIPQKAITDRNI